LLPLGIKTLSLGHCFLPAFQNFRLPQEELLDLGKFAIHCLLSLVMFDVAINAM
jgi:hypothetical protein